MRQIRPPRLVPFPYLSSGPSTAVTVLASRARWAATGLLLEPDAQAPAGIGRKCVRGRVDPVCARLQGRLQKVQLSPVPATKGTEHQVNSQTDPPPQWQRPAPGLRKEPHRVPARWADRHQDGRKSVTHDFCPLVAHCGGSLHARSEHPRTPFTRCNAVLSWNPVMAGHMHISNCCSLLDLCNLPGLGDGDL